MLCQKYSSKIVRINCCIQRSHNVVKVRNLHLKCSICLVHYNVPCTLQCTLYTTMYLVQYNVPCTLQCTLYTTMYLVHYNVPCTLQCTLYTTMYLVQYKMYKVYCTLCTAQCLESTIHCVPCKVHYTLDSIQ